MPNANSQVLSQQSKVDACLYDFVTLPGSSLAGTSQTYFTHTIAGSGQEVTNLSQPNYLPSNWVDFRVNRIGFKLFKVIAADGANTFWTAFKDATYAIYLGQTQLKYGHLSELLGVTGDYYFVSGTTSSYVAADLEHMSGPFKSLQFPISIPASQYFSVVISFATDSTAWQSAVTAFYLKGILTRNIYG